MKRDLSAYITHSDHDGIEFSLPTASYDELWALFVTLLTAIAFPITLVLVAYPAATLFESNRWWLVNEPVLTERWLLAGALFAPLSWLVWPRLLPKRKPAKIRIEQRRIIVRRPGGDWVIPTRDLARIWVSSGGLRLDYLPSSDLPEVVLALPLAERQLWRDIARLVAKHAEHTGTPDAIPADLNALRRARPARTAD